MRRTGHHLNLSVQGYFSSGILGSFYIKTSLLLLNIYIQNVKILVSTYYLIPSFN